MDDGGARADSAHIFARRSMRALPVSVALWLVAMPAGADPQWSAGVQAGVSGAGASGAYWQRTHFFGGLRGDLLWGRARDHDSGLGPFIEVATVGFDDLRLGGGGALLLPVTASLPVVLSAGAYGREGGEGWEPGMMASVFFGARAYNFHSSYGLANGLVVGVQQGLGHSHENAIVIAAQVDALLLAMPLIFGYEWITH